MTKQNVSHPHSGIVFRDLKSNEILLQHEQTSRASRQVKETSHQKTYIACSCMKDFTDSMETESRLVVV